VLPSTSRTWLCVTNSGVLRRAAAKRLKLTSTGRLLWICLSRLWHDWRSALAIVKPETVLAGHRTGWISIVLDLKGAAHPDYGPHESPSRSIGSAKVG
jgi:hypothetical protein